MATTIATKIGANLTTTETLDAAGAPGVSSRALTHNQFDVKKALDGTTTPPVSFISEFKLAAASGTIDLSALPTTEDPSLTAVPKEIVAMRFHNKATAADFVIQVGATNGYPIGGNPIIVKPGGAVLMDFAGGLAPSSTSLKTLDWTLTGYASPDEVRVTLILG